jgi:hypothetical protein
MSNTDGAAAPDLTSVVKLDKTRDHGIYFPLHEGAHFDQDGFLFDHNGNLVEALLTHDKRNQLQAMHFKKAANAAAEKARRAFYEQAGVPSEKIEELVKVELPAAGAAAASGAIDLKAWARREITVPWPKVRDAAMKEFSLGSVKSADELREWMVDNKIVPASVLPANE